MFLFIALFCLLSSLHMTACAAQQSENDSEPNGFRVVTVSRGLVFPWSVAFLPGGDFLVTERGGRMLLLGNDGKTRVVTGLPDIHSAGQGGLLDVITDPDFKSNRTIYFSFFAFYILLWVVPRALPDACRLLLDLLHHHVDGLQRS